MRAPSSSQLRIPSGKIIPFRELFFVTTLFKLAYLASLVETNKL